MEHSTNDAAAKGAPIKPGVEESVLGRSKAQTVQ